MIGTVGTRAKLFPAAFHVVEIRAIASSCSLFDFSGTRTICQNLVIFHRTYFTGHWSLQKNLPKLLLSPKCICYSRGVTWSLVNSQAPNTCSLHQSLSMRFLYLFVCFFLLEVTARISRIQTGLASLWDLITRHNWWRPDGPDAGRFRTSVLCSDLECGLVGLLCNTTERIRVICKDAFTNKTCWQCSLCTYPQYPQNRVLTASTLFRLARPLQGTAVVEWHQGAKKGSRTTSGGKWAGEVDLLLRFFFVDR